MNARVTLALLTAVAVMFVTGPADAEPTAATSEQPPAIEAPADPAAATLSADRPGFADSPSVVAPWRLAVETGLSFGTDGEETQVGLGSMLVRMGVTPWLEARLLAPGLTIDAGASAVSATGAGLGTKIGLKLHDTVQLGLTTMLNLPVGDVSGSVGLSNSLNLGLTLSGTLTMALTCVIGVAAPQGGGGATWEAGGAAAFVAGLGDTSVYAEGVVLGAEDEATTLGFGVGVARMFGDTFQLETIIDPLALQDLDLDLGLVIGRRTERLGLLRGDGRVPIDQSSEHAT